MSAFHKCQAAVWRSPYYGACLNSCSMLGEHEIHLCGTHQAKARKRGRINLYEGNHKVRSVAVPSPEEATA